MSDKELGTNTYTKENKVGKHIMFKREDANFEIGVSGHKETPYGQGTI